MPTLSSNLLGAGTCTGEHHRERTAHESAIG
jgi:hypothetical protein